MNAEGQRCTNGNFPNQPPSPVPSPVPVPTTKPGCDLYGSTMALGIQAKGSDVNIPECLWAKCEFKNQWENQWICIHWDLPTPTPPPVQQPQGCMFYGSSMNVGTEVQGDDINKP